MAADEARHYLTNGQATTPDAREALEWARETTAQDGRPQVLRPARHVAARARCRSRAFDESAFDEGLGFDGSSIRGWQGISESDMLLMPDAASAILDPFTEAPTLSLICEIADPITKRGLQQGSAPDRPRAPRSTSSPPASPTRPTWAPSASSSSSTRSRYALGPNEARYLVDSAEGHWNSGKPGLGYTVREKEGYFPPAPHDTLQRPAHGDGADARAARDPVRVPPPRGRLRRPVRDRPPLPDADAHGRPGHDLQVRGQERRPARTASP